MRRETKQRAKADREPSAAEIVLIPDHSDPDSTKADSMKYSWLPLGRIAPTDLTKPRLQLHRAVQVLAAAADHLLPTAPDHSHASVSWSAAERLLVTQSLSGNTSLRLSLDLSTIRLAHHDKETRSADKELEKEWMTIDEA